MALPRGRSKAELQRLYGNQFRNCNLHHQTPSSRGGETNEFNLFPWKKKRHNAWHYLFLNMTLWEVWEMLSYIHRCLFQGDAEKINRDWLRVCELETEEHKEVQVRRQFRVEILQDKWIIAFGNDDLKHAEEYMKYMMLFIIFGSHMADTDYLFDNGNLTEFFEEYPANEDRLKAFNICFGEYADLQRIKAKVSKILIRFS